MRDPAWRWAVDGLATIACIGVVTCLLVGVSSGPLGGGPSTEPAGVDFASAEPEPESSQVVVGGVVLDLWLPDDFERRAGEARRASGEVDWTRLHEMGRLLGGPAEFWYAARIRWRFQDGRTDVVTYVRRPHASCPLADALPSFGIRSMDEPGRKAVERLQARRVHRYDPNDDRPPAEVIGDDDQNWDDAS